MSDKRTLTFRSDSQTVEYPWGVLEQSDGQKFALTTGRLVFTNEGIELPGLQDPYDRCEKCGRCSWRNVPPQTFDQAIERRWLVPLSEIEKAKERADGRV